jgi:hypothetical protein
MNSIVKGFNLKSLGVFKYALSLNGAKQTHYTFE